MAITTIIPIVAQLLSLSLRLATIIEESKDIDPADKAKLKQLTAEAREGVTYIDENSEGGN